MKSYPWAANPLKLQRAIAEAKIEDEQKIKEIYIRIGGLLLDVPEETVAEEKTETAEEVKTEPSEPIEEIPVEEEKPKKRRAKKDE